MPTIFWRFLPDGGSVPDHWFVAVRHCRYAGPMSFSLDHVIFFGRTWDECLGMYALQESDLAGKRTLDCPGGPDALVAEGLQRGLDLYAIDPQYVDEPDVLEARGRQEITDAMKAWQDDPDHEWPQDEADEFERLKLQALASFLDSYKDNRDRFLAGALPNLPFEDNAFDLILSGHFLFLYASVEHGGLMSTEELNLDFHIRAVREMVRVAPEVRLFPTYATSGPSRRQEYVHPVMDAMKAEGHDVDLVPSNWVQGNFMDFNDLLRIRRSA